MAELPQLVTEPGLSRPFYTGNTRTEAYVTEALRALGDVSIGASAPTAHVQFPLEVNYQHGTPSAMPSALPDNESIVSFGRGRLPGDGDGSSQYRGQYGYDASRPSLGERSDYDRLPADEHGAFLPQPEATRFRSLSSRKPPPASSSNSPLGDDLSSISQGMGSPAQSQAGANGRFATFPVKGKDPVGQMAAEPLVSSRSSLSDVEQTFPKGDLDDTAPKYEAIEGTPTPPPGPPPGAAPPAMVHASIYGGYDPRSYYSGPSFVPDNTVENEHDIQLPYMPSPGQSPRKAPFGSRPLPVPRPLFSPGREDESIQEHNGRSPSTTEPDSFLDPVQTPLAVTQEISTASTVAQDPPSPAPVEDPDDERALNAAAAREVSRELDSLMYQPPAPIPRDPSPQPLAPPTPTTPPTIHTSPRSSIDSVPPASLPFARTRGRVSGPPPVPRTSSERPSPTNGPPSPLVSSTPSSPAQRAQLPPPSIVLARPSSPSLTSLGNPSFRTPPELPPSLSPASSQRSLPQPQGLPFAPGKSSPGTRQGSGMISVAAFRRPVARTGPGSEPIVTGSSQDSTTSPLSVRKKDLRGPHTPRMSGTMGPMSSPPGAQPPELSLSPQELHPEDEFDYISAYYSAGGGDEPASSPPSYAESRARSGSLR
jgi:hypothetical protein